MPKEQSPGKPTTRRYSAEEKAAAVRMPRDGRRPAGRRGPFAARLQRQAASARGADTRGFDHATARRKT